MNEVVLSAVVLEAKPVRYTPAGLPALELVLQHESDVLQAGHQRRIELTIAAIALGDTALLLADVALGTPLTIKGFLAPLRKGSSKLVLHIQQADRHFTPPGTVVV